MTYLEPLIDTAIALLAVAAFILWIKWRQARRETHVLAMDAKYWHYAWAGTWDDLKATEKELDRLQGIIDGMAKRIAAQSELLSQCAEKQEQQRRMQLERNALTHFVVRE